jgi:hypothetical protein
MGVAQGELLKDEIKQLYAGFWIYMNMTMDQYIGFLPQGLINDINEYGPPIALDWEILLTDKFTPAQFKEEMRGLAHGAGVPEREVHQIHVFPELIKAACSMFGAWGNATVQTENGGLVQLRSLDWGTDNPFRLAPTLTIYHPSEGNGNANAIVTWAGFIGALTGYSTGVGICEKVWSGFKGKDKREGIPWTFLLRDILQYDNTVQDALNRINTANRTCAMFWGLGDHATGTFDAVEYSYPEVNVFTPMTPFPGFAPQPPQHPNIPDVVYIDKHVQPSNNPCMATLLQEGYGVINPSYAINMTAIMASGDLHSAVYDYTNDLMYVAVATQTGTWPSNQTVVPAYQRSFLQFDMGQLFSLAQDEI